MTFASRTAKQRGEHIWLSSMPDFRKLYNKTSEQNNAFCCYNILLNINIMNEREKWKGKEENVLFRFLEEWVAMVIDYMHIHAQIHEGNMFVVDIRECLLALNFVEYSLAWVFKMHYGLLFWISWLKHTLFCIQTHRLGYRILA